MEKTTSVHYIKPLALAVSLTAFTSLNANAGALSYGYQSYFHDEVAQESNSNSSNNNVSLASSTSNTSDKVAPAQATAAATAATAAAAAAVAPASAVATAQPTQQQNINGSNNAVAAAATDESPLVYNPQGVSTLHLSQSDQPVHWNSVGRNMALGGLHGNIGTSIEIEDKRFSDSSKNSGKFKLATFQAFLRHDELPNWYLGYYNAREDNYNGGFTNEQVKGNNTINEMYVGHIFEVWHGNIGTEFLIGSETATKRWKYRFKIWQDLRLTDKWSFSGYAFGEFQPRNEHSGNDDLDQYNFELEPSINYRIDNNMGLFVRPFYNYNYKERAQFGDVIERKKKLTAGLWKNWSPLLTSVYIGIGEEHVETSNGNEIFFDIKYHYLGATASYPVFGDVRLYGEFKAQFNEEFNAWDKDNVIEGHSWIPFAIVGVKYDF